MCLPPDPASGSGQDPDRRAGCPPVHIPWCCPWAGSTCISGETGQVLLGMVAKPGKHPGNPLAPSPGDHLATCFLPHCAAEQRGTFLRNFCAKPLMSPEKRWFLKRRGQKRTGGSPQ